jgi:hypothetical protein
MNHFITMCILLLILNILKPNNLYNDDNSIFRDLNI